MKVILLLFSVPVLCKSDMSLDASVLIKYISMFYSLNCNQAISGDVSKIHFSKYFELVYVALW